MVIKGSKKIVLEWCSDGQLLIAQGRKVITISPAQVVGLMEIIEQREDPAIQDYLSGQAALILNSAERNKRGA